MKTVRVPLYTRFLVLLAILLGSLSSLEAAALTEDQLSRRAEAFVDDLHAGRFTNALAHFDETMTAALPADKLAATWQTVTRQAGAFQRRHGTRTEDLSPYRIVLVTCEFSQAWLDAKVVFNQAGQIAGLFFLPARKPDQQTPPYAKPERFREIEVTFGTPGWELPGTLSVPKGSGPFPAVVLVHGSGPNDRDETIGPNKVFRDLAWGLASRGIAVFRYDKRTKTHAQKFIAQAATLKPITVREETMADAGLALALLRERSEVDASRIFLLGHSLGGMLAPRIASDHPGFAGLIILAGSTRPLEKMMIEQMEYIAQADGTVSEQEQRQLDTTRQAVERISALTTRDATNTEAILGAPAAYWLDLRAYDAPATAAKLHVPMLILQGLRDYQVTEKDLAGWRAVLPGRKDVTFKTYPKLHHLFIAGEGPSTPAEYTIPGFVDEEVIRDVTEWISLQPPARR
ncbi:MAG: alpha/beta fold hydrolase [Verrucomicrobiae bacterium]|nr:alpha/beta fold hydrolase [Verrucomicrobiae bacterium]